MRVFYFLVGIPASGKTTFAKSLELKTGAKRLSSDDMRLELFGDMQYQEEAHIVFEEMKKRIKVAFDSGMDVIYDSTGHSSKRRQSLLNQLPKNIYKKCIYLATPVELAYINDEHREHSLGRGVIDKVYKRLQIPMIHEGWDEIEIVLPDNIQPLNGVQCLTDINSYEEYAGLLEALSLDNLIDVAQDSTYHTFSMSRHMYYTYDYVRNLNLENSLNIQIASMFHDIAKPFCKTYKGRYASYYGHENISAQKSMYLLKQLGLSDVNVIDIATLIQLHMMLYQIEDSSFVEKFKKKIGHDVYEKLLVLHDADKNAK